METTIMQGLPSPQLQKTAIDRVQAHGPIDASMIDREMTDRRINRQNQIDQQNLAGPPNLLVQHTEIVHAMIRVLPIILAVTTTHAITIIRAVLPQAQ
jgi:hypothetical protein